MAPVVRAVLSKSFSETFHHFDCCFCGNVGDFLMYDVFELFEGLRPTFKNFRLEVTPQEKITRRQVWRPRGPSDIAS